jgi:hypothetical protein
MVDTHTAVVENKDTLWARAWVGKGYLVEQKKISNEKH